MPGGRPLKFKSVKELEKKIQDYFDSCFEEQWIDEKLRDDNGNLVLNDEGKPMFKPVRKKVQTKPVTITGLAVALDTSRATLINYEEKEQFFNTIKKAKDFVEYCVEQYLFSGKNATGVIFNLKNNFNWKDTQEIIDERSYKELERMRDKINNLTKNVKTEPSKNTGEGTSGMPVSSEPISTGG